MTTPQVPANQLEASDISDEINPSSYVQGEQSIGSNNVVRKLSGTFEKARSNTVELSFSDLANKTAFSEILATSTSNTQSGVGTVDNPVTAVLSLTANTDMVEPVITWTYEFLPGSTATANDIAITRNIVFAPNGRPSSKSANVKLTSLSGDKHANLRITAVMTVPNYDSQGLQEISQHVVNTCTKDITLSVNAVNTAFQITATPSLTVNATGVSAQSATITLKATSNNQLSGVSYIFTPTFVSGTGPLTPVINSDNIIFTATAARPLTNSAVYSVKSDMYYQIDDTLQLVATNTAVVDIRAQFIDRQITSFTAAATVNNQFSNAASQYATIDVTAIHNAVAPAFPQGNVTITVETTGDAVTTQTQSSNTSAKVERISLFYDYAANGFGFKKSVVNVIATLRAPDNTIMDQKRIEGIVLRAGAYGLDIKVPTSNTQSGYAAQTATSSGSATWRATQGDFNWTARQFNGSGPTLTINKGQGTSTVNIIATTPTGKNRAQSIANSSNYDLIGTLTYDGVTVTSVTLSDILIKAESLPYTFSVTPAAASNVQVDVNSGTTASILVTGTASVGTITWTRDNGDVGITTAPTTANVFVTSSSSGSSNNQNVVVTGTLTDGSARTIEAIPTDILNIDATTTKLQITGESVSISTQEKTATATGVYESTSLFGTHSLVFPPVKQSGADLDLTKDSNQKITIAATATQSSRTGTYRITGQVVYRGVTRTTTKDVTVSISALAPSLTATKYPYTYESYSAISGISFTGFGGQVTGIGGQGTYILYKGEDIVVETDYPGTINTDYTIRRVVNRVGTFGEANTTTITGPFYNEAANTNPAPVGFPASINKRRDRAEIVPFIGLLLDYDITYELYDASGKFLKDLNVTTQIDVPKPGANVSLSFDNVTAKTFVITDKPVNGSGYPEPYPATVEYRQRADYSAGYVSETSIPVPRFFFNTVKSNPAASITLTPDDVAGKANVLVKSVYFESGGNFSNPAPVVTDSSTSVDLTVQLTSTASDGKIYIVSDSKTQTQQFQLPMPPGRCYRLATFSTYGVRSQDTRDVFGNDNEIIDYGRLPTSGSVNGPETKWVGFHNGSTIYEQVGRPLYANDASRTRYYSSQAHKTTHQSQFPKEVNFPSKIIPSNYFMVLAFDNGTPVIGQVTLIGSDNIAYPLRAEQLWAFGYQDNTDRNNDEFWWYIFEWSFPAGVTVNYAFISSTAGSEPPPPEAVKPLTFVKSDPGSALIGEGVLVNIGTVSGGVNFDLQAYSGGVE